MDPMFKALSLFRQRKFEEAERICTTVLEKNPYDQVHILCIMYYVLCIISYVLCIIYYLLCMMRIYAK